MTKASRFAVYAAYLDKLGLPNRIDEYGDLEFIRTAPGSTEERRFNIFLVDNDPVEGPEYLSIDCHNFDQVTDGMHGWWVEAMYEINSNFKVVKCTFEDATIRVSCQLFVPSPEVGCQILMRCVEAIESVTPYITDKLYRTLTAGKEA